MRRLFLYTILLLTTVLAASAQSQSLQQLALIDMQYLMSKIPDAQKANKQLQQQSEAWTQKIKALETKAQELYSAYQKDLFKLDNNTKVQRENAIVAAEQEARKLQQQYFGPQGEMLKLQQQLIKPIQDKIYEAVKLISQRRGYLVVLDRATAGNIIFGAPEADISNDVLSVLGYSN